MSRSQVKGQGHGTIINFVPACIIADTIDLEAATGTDDVDQCFCNLDLEVEVSYQQDHQQGQSYIGEGGEEFKTQGEAVIQPAGSLPIQNDGRSSDPASRITSYLE